MQGYDVNHCGAHACFHTHDPCNKILVFSVCKINVFHRQCLVGGEGAGCFTSDEYLGEKRFQVLSVEVSSGHPLHKLLMTKEARSGGPLQKLSMTNDTVGWPSPKAVNDQ